MMTDDVIFNALSRFEVWKVKGKDCCTNRIELIENTPTNNIQIAINAAKLAAIAKGEVVPLWLSASRVKSAHISQLKMMEKRFARTTNELQGGHEFIHDIQQNLLWLQDVLEAWPLQTLSIKHRTYVPGKCEQTLYSY